MKPPLLLATVKYYDRPISSLTPNTRLFQNKADETDVCPFFPSTSVLIFPPMYPTLSLCRPFIAVRENNLVMLSH